MNSTISLDLGTASLKIAELEKNGAAWTLKHLGIVPNPTGYLITQNPEQKNLFIESIKKLVSASKISQLNIRVGLPESHVYTRVIKMPVLSDAELRSAIRWEAEQHIPIPLAEVQLDYSVLSRPEKGIKEGTMEVLLVAAKKDVINYFIDILGGAGLELAGMETAILGLVRALAAPEDPPTLFMNMGASSSDFCIAVGGKIFITYSVPTAGISLTRAITMTLQLSETQAEEYKRAYGLDQTLLEGKVRAAMLPVFKSITSEAKKTINAYESLNLGQKINRVIISGGTALLKEIAHEIAADIGVNEVISSDPFAYLEIDGKVTVPAERPVYSIAIGLAKAGK